MSERITSPESQVPALAKKATYRAYRKARTSGKSVMVAKSGNVIKIHPDGTQTVVKATARATTVKVGTRRTLK